MYVRTTSARVLRALLAYIGNGVLWPVGQPEHRLVCIPAKSRGQWPEVSGSGNYRRGCGEATFTSTLLYISPDRERGQFTLTEGQLRCFLLCTQFPTSTRRALDAPAARTQQRRPQPQRPSSRTFIETFISGMLSESSRWPLVRGKSYRRCCAPTSRVVLQNSRGRRRRC